MTKRILQKGTDIMIGVANIDIYTGKTTLMEYTEEYRKNPTTYDQLERFISIHNPSEVILIYNLPEVESVISYAGIQCDLIHKIQVDDPIHQKRVSNCEKQTYQLEILHKFYKNIMVEHTMAIQSFCFLLDFVYQHNPYLIHQLAEPEWEHTNRLVLANHSLKQLNIIDDGSVKSNKLSSVVHLLNECQTPMGKRKLSDALVNPVCDETYLQKEYDMTEYWLTLSLTFPELSSIKDLSKWQRQLYLMKATPKSFAQCMHNLESIQIMYARCDERIKTHIHKTNVDVECKELIEFIQTHMNVSLAEETLDVNCMNSGIDEELDKKTMLLHESEEKLKAIQTYLNQLIEGKEKKKADYIKIHETEKNQIGFICTKRRCKLLQEALPKEKTTVTLYCPEPFEYVISKAHVTLETQSASNCFLIESQLQTLCKTITMLKITMKDVITRVFYAFVKQFESLHSKLESIISFVTQLDVLHTKACIAKKYKYCKPTLLSSKKSCVKAKKLRHALMEQFQTNELYVSNDMSLGEDTDGILLYGTNAVGKTSLIRALGVAIIMAQAGFYVPCSEFLYKPYKYLFTRILGNDNLFKGLSTFAVEMSELRTILKLSNEHSLILGDELCSGTETQSAISIFVAGIQHLHKRKSSFLFATHLHEVVEYEEITSLESVKMKHMSVIYNKETDCLVYDRKLKDGPGDSMYGLEVCKSLQLPHDFIEAAYQIRSKSILETKQSKYNAQKLVSSCEKCGEKGKEVHHLQYQRDATDGFISTEDMMFHKNHVANLMTLCERCHDDIHTKKRQKKVKTTKGIQFKEME